MFAVGCHPILTFRSSWAWAAEIAKAAVNPSKEVLTKFFMMSPS